MINLEQNLTPPPKKKKSEDYTIHIPELVIEEPNAIIQSLN